jgi:signal transduction histidine kinase
VNRPSFWVRNRRAWNPYVLDGLLALGFGTITMAVLFTAEPTPDTPRDADALGVLLVVIAAGSLLFRRRWPLAVFLVTLAAAYTDFFLGYPDHGVSFIAVVGLYSMASQCERRVTVPATAALLVSFPVAFAVADRGNFNASTILNNIAIFGIAAVWGDRKQVRDAYYEQVELRAAEKERERFEAAERAAAEERLRIARELHDIVAHAMSVVAVQSGVGAHVIDTRPTEAKRILETIAETSRDSLTEMRRLLGVLRDDPDAAGDLAPAPGLAGVEDLAIRVRQAGVPIEVTVRGERPAVPLGADLAAYRIVQEALTNVLKHAGTASVDVLVCYGADTVHLEVVDDGRGAASRGADGGAGHGLVGMRERAALYGGTLEVGPRPGGGFRVAATLRCEDTTA